MLRVVGGLLMIVSGNGWPKVVRAMDHRRIRHHVGEYSRDTSVILRTRVNLCDLDRFGTIPPFVICTIRMQELHAALTSQDLIIVLVISSRQNVALLHC